MKRLCLIRHGQIQVREGQCIGWTDLPLADPDSAKKFAGQYAKLIETPDAVYTSDLKRAVQTAVPIVEHFGCPLIATRELREIHFGKWEGKTWEEIEKEFPIAYDKFMQNWKTAKMPGGESYLDLGSRVKKFLDEIDEKDHQRHVIIGHGGSLRSILKEKLMISSEESFEVKLERGNAIVLYKEDHSRKWRVDDSIGKNGIFSPSF